MAPTTSASIFLHEPPVVEAVSRRPRVCGVSAAFAELRLVRGTPPWSVLVQTPGGELRTLAGRERTLQLPIAASGEYRLVSATDRHCASPLLAADHRWAVERLPPSSAALGILGGGAGARAGSFCAGEPFSLEGSARSDPRRDAAAPCRAPVGI